MSKQDTVLGSPGPWRLSKEMEFIMASNDDCLYEAFRDAQNDRLAVAAPLLYNALRELALHCADPWSASEDEMMRDADEALDLLRAIDSEMRPWPMRNEP